MPQFTGRVIAITGGASGIGLATAHLLASQDATLCLADLNEAALTTACQEIKQSHPNVAISTYPLDVRSETAVAAWISSILTTHGHLHGAANLAGVIPSSIGTKGVSEQSLSEWDFVLGVNLTGVMICLKHQLAAMLAHPTSITGGMSIVNASSIAGLQGMPYNAAYTASKHGVIGLTRSAAKEVGKQGVRVNAVCPGFIDTPMTRRSRELQEMGGTGDKRESQVKSVALGRGGEAREVAELVVWLLGEGAGFVTGNAVSVDGGWNC